VWKGVAEWLKRRLELPEPRGLTHDDARLIAIHRSVIAKKPFLRALYRAHYRELARNLDGLPNGPVVEIGSGPSSPKELMPRAFASDLFPEPHLDLATLAAPLPFRNESLSAVLMLNVFHHLPDPAAFLHEAARVLRPGGLAVLIEPAHTWLWSRLYRAFSAEPYDETREWGFPPSGRFSGANVPQAWIVFVRDRARFDAEFPALAVRQLRHHTAFLYLLSGGIWFHGLVPAWSYPAFAALEKLLTPLMPRLASQVTVVLEKRA
jgi:SAM-dependent methyltransferase